MNNISGRTQQMSLVEQLKRSRLIVVSLIVSIFIFSIPPSIIASSNQHNFDIQKGVLQEDLNSILISMVNQETGLRGYVTTANSAFLQPFTNGRPQYLLAEQRLASQLKGSDFKESARALAQVDERANTWYNTYAQVQLRNMQSGQFETAHADSTNAFGKALFDQFRAAVGHLQGVLGQDLTAIKSRLGILSLGIFLGVVLLALLAVIVLWRTLTRFLKALVAQLNMLMSATTLLGSGDLSARIQELTYDELNRVGQTFNAMAEDLASRSREVERTNSELRDRRDELTAANADLKEANRVRGEFLSTMSHELRTPLASIIGFSQMLLEDAEEADWNQQQRNDLKRILNNGQHLLGLINDVLDLSKIEAGRMVLKYSRIDVQELLTSVVEEIQSMALAQHLILRAEIEDGIGFIESDPLKLRQVLLNLVSNAIKFTEHGEVAVSAKRVISTKQHADQIAFAVKDTGIGISSDVQEHIFEAFYQADGSYTRKFGGTGLGLSIVSQLTALMGGTIAIESTPGQGSTFTVTVPIKAVHHSIEQHLPRLHPVQQSEVSAMLPPADEFTPSMPEEDLTVVAQPAALARQLNPVLVIDDNPDAIVLVKAALQNTHFTVVGVQAPLQVMKLVQELQPCAIILDVMMPQLNGWQILHQLKASLATSSIPVVMLSVIEEQTTGYVLGADDYLIKPFRRDVLLDALHRLISAQEGSTQADRLEAQPV